jgi:hypothetical protein
MSGGNGAIAWAGRGATSFGRGRSKAESNIEGAADAPDERP